MEPPKHRLGDVVDDYCTRCRLLMNHAVVGMVATTVKKVRCQTCLFEHSYRHGRLPKKRDPKGTLYKQVLDSIVQERAAGAEAPETEAPEEIPAEDADAGGGEKEAGDRKTPPRKPRSHSLAAQLGVKRSRPVEPVSPSVQRQPQHRKSGPWRPRREPGGIDARKWMEPGKLFFGDPESGHGRDRGPHRDGDRGRHPHGDRSRDGYHGPAGRGRRRHRRHRGGR